MRVPNSTPLCATPYLNVAPSRIFYVRFSPAILPRLPHRPLLLIGLAGNGSFDFPVSVDPVSRRRGSRRRRVRPRNSIACRTQQGYEIGGATWRVKREVRGEV